MSKKGPITQSRTTVINRSVPQSGMVGVRTSTSRLSMGAPASYNPGVLTGLSQAGVQGVVDTRAREKQDMQGLNERFASYIEKVRFLEAQNKACLMEIERLKKQKGFDPSEIKELYEQEIKEMRKVIDDLSREKADYDATLVGLQDKLDAEKKE